MNVRTTTVGKVHAQDGNGGLRCQGVGSNMISSLFETDAEVTCLACLRHLGRTPKQDTRPVLYAFMTPDGEIFLSAYESDDPMWENNHMIVKDARGSKHESVLNILRNVLYQAGVRLAE